MYYNHIFQLLVVKQMVNFVKTFSTQPRLIFMSIQQTCVIQETNKFLSSTKYGDCGGFALVETWRRHNGITIRIQTLLSSNVRLAFIKTDVAFSSGKGRFIKISYPISLVRVGWCEFDNFITVLLRCLTSQCLCKVFYCGLGNIKRVPHHPGDGAGIRLSISKLF